MARIIFLAFVVCFFLFLPQYPIAQTSNSQKIEDLEKLVEYTSQIEFQYALEDYVEGLFVNYGADKIPQEYFLISLMGLINKEYTNRLDNPDRARQNYFSELKTMLDEIHVLKQRLRNAGINELSGFISDLDARIRFTINSAEVNFKKKRVFEDALQMLYVAEEMIKLDQLQQPEQAVSLNQKLSESKKDILTAFGEVSTGEVMATTGARYTIYDLFTEWKKLDQRKYSLRLTDVKLARQNLIKATDMEGILRMLNAELKMAYDYFNGERYDLSERLLIDVIETYPSYGVKNLDDAYFYRAECNFALNRLEHAETMFQALLQDYPTTTYLPQIYERLVQINYTLEQYSNTINYSGLYQNVSTQADPDFFDVQFLSAMASYQLGDFGKAIDQLSAIPKEHPYHQIALYFTANAYAASQRYDEAIALYLQLSKEKNITPSLYHQTLYKIAIIEYQRKNYFVSIDYLSKIPETFIGYDKVLNAFAWAYYEYEQTKPANERDLYYTKYYANRLINEFYASPYQMEARSLLAYISQLEDRPSNALGLYQDIYQTKLTKSKVGEYLTEREHYDQMFQEAEELKALAFEKGDKKKYLRAIKLMDELEAEMMKMDLTEVSGLGLNAYSELNSVISQLEELSRLRDVAELNEEYEAIQRIDNLRLHLLSVLDRFPAEILRRVERVNLFDEYPISKLIAEEENRTEQYKNNQLEINEEMNKIEARLTDLEKDIQQAKANNDYEKVAELEFQRDRFRELQKDGDNLLSSTYMLERPENVYPEFSKWGDFGAFGIINVQFFQKQQMKRDITEIALGLDKVNKDLEQRRQVIEDKIKKIEAEVRFMTMKARVEERARLRAERERAFREGYFDTRTSESEPE